MASNEKCDDLMDSRILTQNVSLWIIRDKSLIRKRMDAKLNGNGTRDLGDEMELYMEEIQGQIDNEDDDYDKNVYTEPFSVKQR